MGEQAVRLENISKKYIIGHKLQKNLRDSIYTVFQKKARSEEFWALKDISFDVEPGEAIGIIGKNGAGKSTLLKILSRITEPTTGRFEISGRVSSLLEVGTGFHPELTGRENIYLNGTILGMTRSEIKGKYDEIVDFSGVEQFLDTPVKRYSSGMFVRLAFAIAAHLEPEILIIDEVLAVGDMEFQKKCLGKMGDVAKQGRTILFVSHNMSAVQQLCSKSVFLKNGEIQMIGKTSEVIDNYINQSVSSENQYSGRIGDRSIEFTSYYLTNENGNRTNEFFMGDDIFLNVSFKYNKTVQEHNMGIAVSNIYDEKFTHILNYDDKFELSGNEGEEKEIRVKLKDVYFAPGIYKITLGLEKFTIIYDAIYDCLSFNMMQGDKINRTSPFPSDIKTFIKTEWNFIY